MYTYKPTLEKIKTNDSHNWNKLPGGRGKTSDENKSDPWRRVGNEAVHMTGRIKVDGKTIVSSSLC